MTKTLQATIPGRRPGRSDRELWVFFGWVPLLQRRHFRYDGPEYETTDISPEELSLSPLYGTHSRITKEPISTLTLSNIEKLESFPGLARLPEDPEELKALLKRIGRGSDYELAYLLLNMANIQDITRMGRIFRSELRNPVRKDLAKELLGLVSSRFGYRVVYQHVLLPSETKLYLPFDTHSFLIWLLRKIWPKSRVKTMANLQLALATGLADKYIRIWRGAPKKDRKYVSETPRLEAPDERILTRQFNLLTDMLNHDWIGLAGHWEKHAKVCLEKMVFVFSNMHSESTTRAAMCSNRLRIFGVSKDRLEKLESFQQDSIPEPFCRDCVVRILTQLQDPRSADVIEQLEDWCEPGRKTSLAPETPGSKGSNGNTAVETP